MNFVILANVFIDPFSERLCIGGLQTYIKDLAHLAQKMGYNVIVVQSDNQGLNKTVDYDGITVALHSFSNNQKMFNSIYAEYNSSSSIFVISTDQMNIKTSASNVIAIQHGVAFDIPGEYISGLWGKNKITHHINKILRCIRNVQRFYWTQNTVCVDYNYYNWFRTIGTVYPSKKVKIIPNYSLSSISHEELDEKLNSSSNIRKIVFARRFVEHRGILLFANVVKRILTEIDNVDVTFAGEGPFDSVIKEMFKDDKHIHFSSFTASESVQFHKQYDIAVIPTIFSEGTSLSLCEAMSAGLFPICSCVGGLSNMILDHYNGIICMPNERELYSSLKEALLMDEELFNAIRRNAYTSALCAFSHKRWEERWIDFIKQIQ